MIRGVMATLFLFGTAAWLDAQPAIMPKEVASVPGQITGLIVSPDGKHAAASTVRIMQLDGKRGGDGNEMVVWEIATGKQVINTGKSEVRPLHFAADGKSLVAVDRPRLSEETQLQTWDLGTGKAAEPTTLAKVRVFPMPSLDRKTYSGVHGDDKAGKHTFEKWEAATGKSLATVEFEAGAVHSARQVEKGPFLAVVATEPRKCGLLTRDAKTGKTSTKELPGVSTAFIAPDGKLIAGVGEQGLKVFDSTGKLKWSATGDHYYPDFAGKLLIATHPTGKIYLYDAATGRLARTIATGLASIPSVDITPDGKTLLASGPTTRAGEKFIIQQYALGK